MKDELKKLIEIRTRLALKATADGRFVHAERLYKQALRHAEAIDSEGPITGLVLLDLHDFYEKQGRHDEAAPAWERVRRILIGGMKLWTNPERW